MSELLFFIFTHKGITKAYYRRDNVLYDDLFGEVRSEEVKASVMDSQISYYRLSDIIEKIDSLPVWANFFYIGNDDATVHCMYVIMSTTQDHLLKVITLEEPSFSLENYVPYEINTLFQFPSPTQHRPFDIYLLNSLVNQSSDIGGITSMHNFTIEHFSLVPEPVINPSTGLPKFLLIHNLHVEFISFAEYKRMRRSKTIHRCYIDNTIQKWATAPNIIITVFGINGITYLLNAKYDREKNTVSPPN